MKLYSLDLSPFASRCRIQIYAKGLDVELAPPPGGTSTDEYRAINPTGRVPALALDDAKGTVLAESDAISEYLEDCFPEPALRPADVVDRARMRVLQRITDSYIVPRLQELFGQRDPATRDAKLVEERLGELRAYYDQLEAFLAPGPYAVGASLSLADCTLAPIFFFATRLHPTMGDKDPMAERPKLAAWWDAVRQHEAVAKVERELEKALAVFLAG